MGCRIEVKNIKPGSGKRICQADLCIIDTKSGSPLVTLKECTIYQGQNGDALGLPQRNYQKDGETRYVNVVDLPEHTKNACINALAMAWAEHTRGNPQESEPEFNDPFADE